MRRLHLTVHGRVQGVCYRAETRAQALALGLRGWVRNRRDGSVEVVAEGEDEAVDALLAWCRQGPPWARVERVEPVWEETTGAPATFEVIRTP